MGTTGGSFSGGGGAAGDGDPDASAIGGGGSGGMAGSAAGGGGAAGASGGVGTGGMGGFGFGGPSRCDAAGVQLCETFENGLDAMLWTTTRTGDATVTVDEIHAARGTKALHVKTASGSGHAYITERKTFPAVSNTLYARMFIWFDDDITTPGHFSLAEGAGTGNGALVRFGGQFREFGVGSDGGGSGDWTDHDNVIVASKKWLCIEFQYQGTTNMFHVWTDDVARTALDSGANRHGAFVMPQFTSLWFGWWMYNTIEPQDLWIDEIAIDSKPIGCAK